MKKKLILAVLALSLFSLIYQVIFSWPDNYLRITFCDVGQGDAILITHKFNQVLIDGGPDDAVLACLQEQVPFWDTQLDLIVATHPDADHITGLSSVLKLYNAGLIMTEASGKDTNVAANFYRQVQVAVGQGSVLVVPRQGQRLSIGQKIQFKVLWPLEEKEAKLTANSTTTETILSDAAAAKLLENSNKTVKNDRSIVLNMQFDHFRVFLPGDLEAEGEQALVKMGLIKEVDLLKTPHHGSKTSTTPELVEHLRPEIAVISSGKNNQFGHPNSQVLDRLSAQAVKILRTDAEGPITFVSDGKHYWRSE